jgi:hypothetical protein
MLDDVVERGGPFRASQGAIQPLSAQFPGGELRGKGGGFCLGDQTVALEQAPQSQQALGAAIEAAADEAGIAADLVERFALLGCFGPIEGAYMQAEDTLFAEQRSSDRGDTDIQTKCVGL